MSRHGLGATHLLLGPGLACSRSASQVLCLLQLLILDALDSELVNNAIVYDTSRQLQLVVLLD